MKIMSLESHPNYPEYELEYHSRTDKWDMEIAELKLMLNVEQLPNQQINEDEWKIFEERLGSGDSVAKDELVPRLFRRAYSLAKWYSDKLVSNEQTLEDHFQHAVEGACIAVDDYASAPYGNLYEHIRLTMWSTVYRQFCNSGLVQFSRSFNEDMQKIDEASEVIAEQIGIADAEDISISLVADKTGLSRDEVNQREQIFRSLKYEQLISGINLDELPSDYMSPIDITASRFQKEDLHEVLQLLKDRERNILVLRYGFVNDKTLTHAEIGEMYNLTRQRIRAIEVFTLKKIRALQIIEKLRNIPEGYITYLDPHIDNRAGMPK